MEGAVGQLSIQFDYTSLGEIAKQDKSALEKHAATVEGEQEKVRKTTAESVLKIGKELAAARERLANHGNGTFGKWLKGRLCIGQSSAYKAMTAYESFKNLPHCGESFDASSLYLLSSDSVPEEATKEAIKRAAKGEQITHKLAKEIVAKHSPEPEPLAEREDDDIVDDAEWSYGQCLMSLRREVKRWSERCPKSDLSVIVEILGDLKAQIERTANGD